MMKLTFLARGVRFALYPPLETQTQVVTRVPPGLKQNAYGSLLIGGGLVEDTTASVTPQLFPNRDIMKPSQLLI